MNYTHPEVGAQVQNDKIVFTVWAPLVQKVEIILQNQEHTMTKDERGYWTLTIPYAAGLNYQYKLNGEKTFPDPASRWQPEGVHGPSAVAGNSFSWNDLQWKGLTLGEMIIYELHVGTFTEIGTFDGVVSKLGYLKDLGINAIELMPIAQFPGERNWGYDGVFPFAVQESYGGVEGLKRLVDAAHRSGIAVILDVVYNHLGPEGNYLGEFGPYFTEKYKTGWGSAVNFDDAWCDGVRNFYWQNARMWLDEFHIDGLRLDAVHAIWDSSANHFIQKLKENTSALEKSTGKKKVLIAEFDLNNTRYINAISKGGYGLDGQWIDEFHHALHAIVTGETNGYYEDFGTVEHLAKSLLSSYVYTGEYSIHRKKDFGMLPEDNAYDQFVVFSQNHDQIGNRLLGDRLTAKLSFEKLKLVAATVLLSPHVPMLFMGEEYGEKNPFQYFISHTDEHLVDLVRKGRKQEFVHFGWTDDIPDPQGVETFEQCKLSWALDKPEGYRLFLLYKYLIGFRKERLALKGTARNSLQIIETSTNGIISFERRFGNDALLIVLNFNKETATVAIPYHSALKIFDSAATLWNGPGELAAEKKGTITLHGDSVVILEL
jgi:maltooligosyltrehalose trehalohydrolase